MCQHSLTLCKQHFPSGLTARTPLSSCPVRMSSSQEQSCLPQAAHPHLLFPPLSSSQLLPPERPGQLCLEAQTDQTGAHKAFEQIGKIPLCTCQNSRSLTPVPVPFARRREAPDYDFSFELNVHKPTIVPMTLLVSRTFSTVSQFTCVMPRSTGEIQQRKTQKTVLCFRMTSFMEKRFTNFTEKCQEPSVYYRSSSAQAQCIFPSLFSMSKCNFFRWKGKLQSSCNIFPSSCKVFLQFLSTVFQDGECYQKFASLSGRCKSSRQITQIMHNILQKAI